MSYLKDHRPRRPEEKHHGSGTSFEASEIERGWKMEDFIRKASLGLSGYVLAAVAIPFTLYLSWKAVRNFGEFWTAKLMFQQRNSTSPSLDGEQTSESALLVSSPSTQTAFSSFTRRWKYDVFLSFHGKDTRKNFTDHLHTALREKGIAVFRDDEKLEQGTSISRELLKGIRESQYAIVIISENYAFSKWCLMELTKILECTKETQMTILPVFYHVDPSNVRKLKGSFAKAFAKHCRDRTVDEEQRKSWIATLEEVGHLTGWHVYDRPEAVVVEEICTKINGRLDRNLSFIPKDLVGIESQVEKILTLLSSKSDDVRFLGIYGMGGIGKTTLAKVIYEMVIPHFEANCFIANVREEFENGRLCDLQTQLISETLKDTRTKIWNDHEGSKVIASRVCNKKVLIVLDDVNREEQLKALAKSHDWFGPGSRVLVTSRDHQLLIRYMDSTYKVNLLDDANALKLLSLKAFNTPYPESNYKVLSKEIASYAEGLPLALDIFGSFLFGRTMDEWKSSSYLLKTNPNSQILDKLQISFDGLEYLQKELFLDIACFFKGENVNEVINKFEILGYYPKINIQVLVDKSLVTIYNSKLYIHDLLGQMCQQIIGHQFPSEYGKWKRLWHHNAIIHVLKNDTYL